MAHIVLREFIGFGTPAPLWFDEGAACANEEMSNERYIPYAKRLLAENKYIPIQSLERLTYATMDPEIFYPEAAALLVFLLEHYKGRTDFVEFCRELRDGTPFYEAMRKVYRFENAAELNAKFVEFLRK